MARRERRTCSRLPVTSEQPARRTKALSPSRLSRFSFSPALFVGYGPLAVCVLLAPSREEKSAATRHVCVPQQALRNKRRSRFAPANCPLPARRFRSLHNPAALRRRDRIAET